MSILHQYEYGLSDLIQPLALVANGVVALKDGGLLAGWRFRGTSDPERLENVRDKIAKLLNYGKGWVFETNAIRMPSIDYPAWGNFPDPVSKLIEKEREENYTAAGRYYATSYYLTLSYFPPSQAGERTKGWFYESTKGQDWAENVLAHFQEKVQEFEALASPYLELQRLRRQGSFDNLLRYIDLCITGDDMPFPAPDIQVDLDLLLGNADLSGGTTPLLNGHPLRVLAVDPLPDVIYPGTLHVLEQLPMSFRLHGRAILLDRHEAAKLHDEKRKSYDSKVVPLWSKISRGAPSHVNQLAAELAAEANIAKSLTEERGEAWALFSSRVVLLRHTEEQMDRAIEMVQKAAQQTNLRVRVETINVNDAWCGSLPGHAFFDIRQVPVRAFNVAGMSPLLSNWAGHAYCPSPKMPAKSSPLLIATGRGETPYRHNLHVQDVGHCAMFGPTGNGKSTIFGLHAVSTLRYPNAEVVMFDRNKTQYVLCKALGGRFYDFGSDKSLELCPLKYLDTASDQAFAGNYIEQLCRMNGLELRPEHTDRIGRTVDRFSRSENRSLTNFAGSVGDIDIQTALQYYTIGNPISARMLDGESDSIQDAHFTVFEMAELMQMNRRISMAVEMYLFRRVERKLNANHITGIFIDEARRMIGDDLFASTIENWLKETRNQNGFVKLALQEIEDGIGTKLRSVIEQQCKTKIFLPNPAARAEATKAAYTALGLSDYQIQQIVDGQPKRDYFISTPDHWTPVTFDLEKVTLSFISANTPADHAQVDQMIAANPDSWVADFLRSRGLEEWADYYLDLYQALGIESWYGFLGEGK